MNEDKVKELEEKITGKWKIGSTPDKNGVYIVCCVLGDGDIDVALGNFYDGKWLNFFFDYTVLLADIIDYNSYEVEVLSYVPVANVKDVCNWLDASGVFDKSGYTPMGDLNNVGSVS